MVTMNITGSLLKKKAEVRCRALELYEVGPLNLSQTQINYIFKIKIQESSMLVSITVAKYSNQSGLWKHKKTEKCEVSKWNIREGNKGGRTWLPKLEWNLEEKQYNNTKMVKQILG